MPTRPYRINSQDVVHELIDGDAILINMTTGRYFSLEGSGAVIWEILQQGAASAPTLAKELAARYQGDLAIMESEAVRILGEMQGEGLVQVAGQEDIRPPTQVTATRLPFESLTLNKYTDLEALLLLDPVHDVSSEGWPHKKSNDA
ncbi:PqqD family protein [Gammaproteobacteria bacterium]